jgi:hypothetical protein
MTVDLSEPERLCGGQELLEQLACVAARPAERLARR